MDWKCLLLLDRQENWIIIYTSYTVRPYVFAKFFWHADIGRMSAIDAVSVLCTLVMSCWWYSIKVEIRFQSISLKSDFNTEFEKEKSDKNPGLTIFVYFTYIVGHTLYKVFSRV